MSLSIINQKQLTFQKIDERFLKKLMLYCKTKHKLSETIIMNIMVFIYDTIEQQNRKL